MHDEQPVIKEVLDALDMMAREVTPLEKRRTRHRKHCAAWRQKYPEKVQAYSKKHYAENRDRILAQKKAEHLIPEIRAKLLARHKEQRLAHPEAEKEYGRRNRLKRAQKRKAETRAWKKNNPQRVIAMEQRRKARKRAAPINDFTIEQWEEMKRIYNYKCQYCGRKMKRLTQDHITPLIKGGSHTASNIIPACQSCNSKKKASEVLVPIQPLLLMGIPGRAIRG